MAKLALTFFGSFQARLDGKLLTGLSAGRVQNLLAYLVLEAAHPQARSTLAALFWPDEPETFAKQSLRQAIYQLRQQVGESTNTASPPHPFLLVERDTLQFNPASDYTLDVNTFQTLLKQGQRAEAVAHYHGELLSGLNSASASFEEWILLRREALHIQALDALDHLTQQSLQANNFAQAQDYARRQLTLEPWREAAHRHLILALSQSGDRAAALAQSESCRQILRQELNIDPDPATVALVEQIRKGEADTETRRQGDQETRSLLPLSLSPPLPLSLSPCLDWGEAPDIPAFQGRQEELADLERWLVRERCRLVSILGMGGMGKTSLAVKIGRQVAEQFAFVIWRSLLNAPPLGEILYDWQQVLSGPQADQPTKQQRDKWPESLDAQLASIFEHLRRHRCLLVLDNAESIMQGARLEAGEAGRAGYFRPGYEEYGQLFKRMGETPHQSCLLLTSREQPQEVARLERANNWVRSLPLYGLTSAAGQAILQRQGVRGDPSQTQRLIEQYSGNPLALMLVAETIAELFDGDIETFLQEEAPIFDDIRDILAQQFARLTPLEQEILRWLALEREPLSAQQLADTFAQPVTKRVLLEALTSLRRRSLIEKVTPGNADLPLGQSPEPDEGGFILQNVVTEYITDTLIDQISTEIEEKRPLLLKRHALLKAQAREYVRQSQERLLLQPIIARLRAKWGEAGLVDHLRQGLETLRQQPDQQSNYGGGNLLNLLIHVGANLHQLDLSHLAVWQAHLKGISLPAVNLAYSNLKQCVFTDTFGAIVSLGFSPDGKQMAAGSTVGQIHLWRVSDGQASGVLAGHTSFVFSVFFTPDHQHLISGSDDQLIRLWQISGGAGQATVQQTLRAHSQGVWRLAISRHGDLLASASGDRSICLWDLTSGQLRHTLRGHQSGIRAVAISPDGKTVASGDEQGLIDLWQSDTGELLARFKGQTGSIWSLAFHPNGQSLASSGRQQTIHIWRLADLLHRTSEEATKEAEAHTQTAWRILSGHSHYVASLAFSPDGSLLASGSHDQTVRVWDVAQGLLRHTLDGHTDDINCVAFHPNGVTLASGGSDRSVRLWDAQRGHALRTFQGHVQGIMAVALSPDGMQLAAASLDHTVKLWREQTSPAPTLPQKEGAILSQTPVPPLGYPLGGEGRRGQLFPAILQSHRKDVHTVAFHPAGKLLASGSVDHTLQLWEQDSGKVRMVLRGHQGWIRLVCFTPDGNHLLSCSNDWTMRLWDVSTGECLKKVQTTESVWAFALLPNPPSSENKLLLVSGGTSNTVRLWDLLTGEVLYILHGHTNWVVSVAISPDGTLLATGSADQTVRIWDLASGELRHLLTGHQGWVYALAFAPEAADGTLLLASGSADQSICLWDVKRGALLQRLQGHSNEVRSLTFVPPNLPLWGAKAEANALQLISGSVDETVRIWEVASGRCIELLRAPRPYEGTRIDGATGITEAQKTTLKALGAVEG